VRFFGANVLRLLGLPALKVGQLLGLNKHNTIETNCNAEEPGVLLWSFPLSFFAVSWSRYLDKQMKKYQIASFVLTLCSVHVVHPNIDCCSVCIYLSGWAITMGRLPIPKMGNGIKCHSHEHSDARPIVYQPRFRS